MANVVTEHVILISMMVICIIFFSTVANSVASNYINQQNFLIAQGAVNQLASTIQQIHYSINQYVIMPGTWVKNNPLPHTILSYPYKVTGDLEIPLDA